MPDRKIIIKDHMQLSKAKEQFNSFFPFLRIEFFPADTGSTQPNTKKVLHEWRLR